jgi:carbon monoxide dehydrogenase subunit G
MEFTGRYTISAPIELVWEGILDPAVLKACIPGCEKLEQPADGQYVATVKLKIGPVSATFNGKVTLSDIQPPKAVRLTGEGQGGVAGFAKGSALVALERDGDATVLYYSATASVGGKLAQIGQRLIDGAAKQIADNFFQRFSQTIGPQPVMLEGDPTTAELEGEAAMAPGVATAEAAGLVAAAPVIADTTRTGLSPVMWVGGLIALVALLLLVFGWLV